MNAMKYNVWCPELSATEDDSQVIEAVNPSDAAMIWAKKEDVRSADYWIVGGQTPLVCVRLIGGGPVRRYRVHRIGDYAPVYFADPA